MFKLDDKQLKELAKWKSKHEKKAYGTIGGRYTYCFTPTSLGEIAIVKDAVTGEEINLTDFDSW